MEKKVVVIKDGGDGEMYAAVLVDSSVEAVSLQRAFDKAADALIESGVDDWNVDDVVERISIPCLLIPIGEAVYL